MPSESQMQTYFSESFVIYRPKDIVSGDIYWLGHNPIVDNSRNLVSFALIDCTGHGVPGAFMSMIGDAMLNQIINIQRVTSPDIILNELHRGIRLMLKQQDGENRDGMDISICTIDLEAKIIEFASEAIARSLAAPAEGPQ